jgi:hypothetical protein
MATDEFTLAEAQEKRGQIVRSRASIPWPDGVIGKIVDVGFAPCPADHPPERVVFTIEWQLYPAYGVVPRTALPLSKRQYEAYLQDISLTDEEQHKALFGF